MVSVLSLFYLKVRQSSLAAHLISDNGEDELDDVILWNGFESISMILFEKEWTLSMSLVRKRN